MLWELWGFFESRSCSFRTRSMVVATDAETSEQLPLVSHEYGDSHVGDTSWIKSLVLYQKAEAGKLAVKDTRAVISRSTDRCAENSVVSRTIHYAIVTCDMPLWSGIVDKEFI